MLFVVIFTFQTNLHEHTVTKVSVTESMVKVTSLEAWHLFEHSFLDFFLLLFLIWLMQMILEEKLKMEHIGLGSRVMTVRKMVTNRTGDAVNIKYEQRYRVWKINFITHVNFVSRFYGLTQVIKPYTLWCR